MYSTAPKCLSILKITDLWNSHICWLDSVRLDSSHENTKHTDRYGVNKQNKNHHSVKDKVGKS